MNLYLFNLHGSAATYGIGTYLSELTQALAGTDVKIHIVHLHSTQPEFEIVSTDQVENWFVPEAIIANTIAGDGWKLENYYRNVIYLLRLYIKETDGLVFHFNYNQFWYLSKGLKAAFDCQTVCTVHFLKWSLLLQGNLSNFQMLKAKPEDLLTEYEQLLIDTDEYEGMLYQEVDRVIALTLDMKNYLQKEHKLNPAKIKVIPNGLKDMKPTTETDRERLRKNLQISENEFVILFVGRLNPVKGLFFLIESFHKVLEKTPDCRLLIAGGGRIELFMQVTQSVKTKVTFTGLLSKKDLSELYQIADVGVIPSLYETFSFVAIEMMKHGLPMIATATSGLNEVVDDSCSLKIPVTFTTVGAEIDTDELSEKILYLLKNPAEAKEMGRNGRKRFLQNYSSEVFRQNMLNFYHSLATDYEDFDHRSGV